MEETAVYGCYHLFCIYYAHHLLCIHMHKSKVLYFCKSRQSVIIDYIYFIPAGNEIAHKTGPRNGAKTVTYSPL